MALRADAEHGCLQQRGGVAPAGKDGTGRCTSHRGRWHFVTGIQVHRLPQQCPQRQISEFFVGRTHDLHALVVVIDILHQRAEAIPQKEADGEPGRVGSQPQNVERAIGVNAQIVTGQTVC